MAWRGMHAVAIGRRTTPCFDAHCLARSRRYSLQGFIWTGPRHCTQVSPGYDAARHGTARRGDLESLQQARLQVRYAYRAGS